MSKPILAMAAACLTGGAAAQTSAAPASGGLAALLSGGIPNVASVGAGNAAGLLGYCLKNKLLGADRALGGLAGRTAAPAATSGTGAEAILQRLTGREGLTRSPGYAAGQAGQVQPGSGRALSLDSLGGQVKTRVCGLVLNRAKALL